MHVKRINRNKIQKNPSICFTLYYGISLSWWHVEIHEGKLNYFYFDIEQVQDEYAKKILIRARKPLFNDFEGEILDHHFLKLILHMLIVIYLYLIIFNKVLN